MSRSGTLNIGSGSKTKRWLRRVITILLSLAAIVGGYFLMDYLVATWQNNEEIHYIESIGISTKPVTQAEIDDYKVDPDKPRYISIPRAGVTNARAIALGVKSPAADGSQQLDAPTRIGDTGWYNCQINPIADNRCDTYKTPGDGNTETAALFDGHTCFSRAMSCVFDQISSLKNSDSIVVERGDGQTLQYVVRKVQILNLADVDMKAAMKPLESGREGLTLITCAGTYKGAVDASGVPTASKRVLVYAVLNGIAGI